MAEPGALAAAVLARLRTLPRLTIFDSQVPETPPGAYVVFYDDAPRLSARSHVGIANRLGWSFQTVCAGRDANEVRWVVGSVLGALANWRPLPDRSTSWLMPAQDGAPILKDESVPGDLRFSQTLTFRLTTIRS